MTCRTIVALLAALLAAPCLARAEARDVIDAVREHDRRAQQRFEGGDYEGALDELHAAQRLLPAAERLFSMAVCQRRLGRPREAMALYRRYLDDPGADDEHRELARRHLESLRAELDEGAVAASGEDEAAVFGREGEPAAAGPARRRRLPRAPFFAMLGVTGAAALSFAVLGGVTLGMHREFLVTDPATQADRYLELRDAGRRMNVATDVLLGFTCVAAAAAVILALFTD